MVSTTSRSIQNGKLLLGSTGFLGRHIVPIILQDQSCDFFAINSRFDAHNSVNVIKAQGNSVGPFWNSIPGFNFQNITIVNCVSGRFQDTTSAQESHFNYPREIFDSAVLKFGKKFLWIQPESYSQFSSQKPHDVIYVSWKSKFSEYLETESEKNGNEVQFLTLPHLYGPGDKSKRFLPKLFRTILQGGEVHIFNPHEMLSVTDVRDVAKFISQMSYGAKNSAITKRVLFPIQEHISVLDIAMRFRMIVDSESIIHAGRFDPDKSIEELKIEEQPKLLDQAIQLRTCDTTLREIAEEILLDISNGGYE